MAAFEAFGPENDPYGEHDFGALTLAGERILFKLDDHDRSMLAGSPDPADPAVTTPVLTLLLAREY